MTRSQHQMVADFHSAFGHPIHTEPTEPSRKLRRLRLNLLMEELKETSLAARRRDIIEIADGLADVAYIGHGTLHAYGYQYRPSAAVVAKGRLGYVDAAKRYIAAEEWIIRQRLPHTHPDRRDLDAQLADGLNLLLVAVRVEARELEIPFPQVFQAVHTSNMAKLNAAGRPTYRADGKLLKPANWQPPNIHGILTQHAPHLLQVAA